MTDIFLRIGASNLCLSVALAVVAWVVHAVGRHPRLAHLLWLLVLVKLVTPPVVTVPILAVPEAVAAAPAPLTGQLDPAMRGAVARPAARPADLAGASGADPATSRSWRSPSTLVWLWLLGSLVVLSWSLPRVFRFHRLLGRASIEAPADLQAIAGRLATRLGLARVPRVVMTTARLSPMVWWCGGRVRVVIPSALRDEMGAGELRWVLAHEIAHVKRRDHMVRWLEWLACVAFWWNPVAWMARAHLRSNEEVCCDALVLESFGANPQSYASSLLSVVEFLAAPALRQPAVASEMNGGGFLERRFEMIMSNEGRTATPRWAQALVLILTLALLPLGVVYAQDPGDRQDRSEARQDESARKKGGLARRFAALGIKPAVVQKVSVALAELGDLDDEQVEQCLGVMVRLLHGFQAGKKIEPSQRLDTHLEEKVGLDGEQIDLLMGFTRRLSTMIKKSSPLFPEKRVAAHLKKIGLTPDKVEKVMGLFKRALVGVQSGRKPADVKAWVGGQLPKFGITEARDQQIQALYDRLVAGLKKKSQGDQVKAKKKYLEAARKIETLVANGEMTAEEGQRKLEALRAGLAARAEKSGKSKAKPKAKVRYRELAAQIKKAVARGDLTEAEAEQKLAAIRKEIAAGEKRRKKTAEDYEAAMKKIRQMVVDGELTREEAGEKIRLLREKAGRIDKKKDRRDR